MMTNAEKKNRVKSLNITDDIIDSLKVSIESNWEDGEASYWIEIVGRYESVVPLVCSDVYPTEGEARKNIGSFLHQQLDNIVDRLIADFNTQDTAQ